MVWGTVRRAVKYAKVGKNRDNGCGEPSGKCVCGEKDVFGCKLGWVDLEAAVG